MSGRNAHIKCGMTVMEGCGIPRRGTLLSCSSPRTVPEAPEGPMRGPPSWERSFLIVIPHPDAGPPVVGTQSDDRFSLNQKHYRLFGYRVHKGQIPHLMRDDGERSAGFEYRHLLSVISRRGNALFVRHPAPRCGISRRGNALFVRPLGLH